MAKKKHKSYNQSQPPKPKKGNINSLGFIKEALTLIGGLAGSILAIYGLVKTFKDDAQGFSWLIFVGIVIWFIVLWRLFQVRKTTAYSLFIISMLVGSVGWIGWQSQVKATEDKVVVLVAQFDGPEETYGLRKQIMEALREGTKKYINTTIIDGEETVTSGQGSEYARELGKDASADLVIWAWYQPTENPNITIHVENLSIDDLSIIEHSQIYQPSATIKDLESFEIQKQIGTETTKLIAFLVGYVSQKSGDCPTAMPIFREVLQEGKIEGFVSRRDVLYLSGSCHFELGEYKLAVQDYDEILQENQNDLSTYLSRGAVFANLDQKEKAVSDFDKAIELDSKSVEAHLMRARYFISVNDYQLSFSDIDKALELDPNNIQAYALQASAYNQNHQFDLAIQSINKAIQLDPKSAVLYNNRGGSYNNLRQFELAIKDYNKALRFDPQVATIYNNRGFSYDLLGKDKRAIDDYTRAIEIDPNYSLAYRNRGIAYREIGEWGKAEADFKKYEELTGEKP